jgi:N utilization substance protein A
MSAKKKEAVQEPQIKFADAVKNVAETKGLDTETVATALKEAIEKSYIRSLGGGDDARVEFEIDPETGAYSICQIKTVRDEDDITDDYLEISTEEANEKYRKKGAPKYKPGDDCRIYADNESLSKVFVTAVKNNLRQKLGDAERMALYEQWKDHIGEMVTGTVEKSDDHGTTISIGRTTVELGRRQMIGDERFSVGEPIKVYIQEVKPVNQEGKPQRGPMIEVTRSSEGFLKRLFEEEIREIYEGIVIIKGIAREAGVRSLHRPGREQDPEDRLPARERLRPREREDRHHRLERQPGPLHRREPPPGPGGGGRHP